MSDEAGDIAYGQGATADEVVEVKDPKLRSRVLYPNPVVCLVTHDLRKKANVMVLSWLTMLNNQGTFAFSINKTRHSRQNLMQQRQAPFTLAVPVKGMEEALRQIGKSSGKYRDKFEAIEDLTDVETLISSCAAWMECSIIRVQDADDWHDLVTAQIRRCVVKKSYWNGKQFLPVSSETPPYLTFLGSQRFGYVQG